jgi:flagellum-specific ATP synthase
MITYNAILSEVRRVQPVQLFGHVTGVLGMMLEIGGITQEVSIGDRCRIQGRKQAGVAKSIQAEIIGFRNGRAVALPFGLLDGVGLGQPVEMMKSEAVIYPEDSWLGRVINANAEPIDGKGGLSEGATPALLRNTPPPANLRQRVGTKIDLGVRPLNAFLTCCKGQRMGIFAGSGVGKSVLLGMLARYSTADIIVIGLIGERGREVQEFIDDDLGPEGLARSVLIIATSDESPLMRRQAAQTTLAVAEYFRDQGKDVLCLMDSVTRFAMAQREIGLSAGEPPASKGYTPTVFAELPKLLERAGPGVAGSGSITALFTVLVEGDDMNEPIADAVRGILDGHIVLDRKIAERGRYPAINILRSISRTMPGCNSEAENVLIRRARQLLSSYEDMAELIRLGAYRRGSDPQVDEAILFHDPLEQFLSQNRHERADLQDGYQELAELLQTPPV